MNAIGVTRIVCSLVVFVSAFKLGGGWGLALAIAVWFIWALEDA